MKAPSSFVSQDSWSVSVAIDVCLVKRDTKMEYRAVSLGDHVFGQRKHFCDKNV